MSLLILVLFFLLRHVRLISMKLVKPEFEFTKLMAKLSQAFSYTPIFHLFATIFP